MDEKKRKFGLRHGVGIVVALILGLVIAAAYFIASGLADRWARKTIVDELEKTTGARVELGNFHIVWRSLTVRFDGLTLHGREPAGGPPLFHADLLQFDLHIDSLWGRKISLGSVEMARFSANVQVAKDGSTNLPGPAIRVPSGGKPVEGLFALKVQQLRLEQGQIQWKNEKIPFEASGGQLDFAMNYADEGGRPVYLGQMDWQQFRIAAFRDTPFVSNLMARFTLRQDSFSLTQLQWKTTGAELDAQATLANFSEPAWKFRYRGELRLEDLWTVLRRRGAPGGHIELTGEGVYAGSKINVDGRYVADRLSMNYHWFHPGNISIRGSYRADNRGFDSPDLEASILGGTAEANLHLDFAKFIFRAQTRVRGMQLHNAMAAEDNPNLPINPLHWESSMDIDATTTWTADFKHVDSQGSSVWTPPATPTPGRIPTSAMFDFHYDMDRELFVLSPGEISTPSSRIQFRASALSMENSNIDLTVDTDDLMPWDDFINRLRGENAVRQIIGGRFHWDGKLTGPLNGPTFSGRFKGSDANYGPMRWDDLEGEFVYSPEELRLIRVRAKHGKSSADLELSLDLDNWSFAPDSQWTFDVNVVAADTDDLQGLLGRSYPVHGILTGQFHGKGTRAAPEFSGLFDLSAVSAYSWRFDRARGQLNIQPGDVRISNAEVRLAARAPGEPVGLVTGNLDYRTDTDEATFDFTGAGIPLEAVDKVQMSRLPVGGRLNFQAHGQGPLRSPELQATLRLVDLKLGDDVVGSFDGKVDSDGRHLNATIDSFMPSGKLTAKLGLGLGGDYPVSAELTAERIDFNPFLVTALHLSRMNGHSLVDGHFIVAGFGARPETIAVETDISRLTFDFQKVKLENDGPIRLTYRGDEVRIEQADLRGTDTDFKLSGSARFAGDQALNLRLDGAVSLQLIGGFYPQIESGGRAQINALVAGTVDQPRLNGKVHIEGASLRYGDFPAGLSNVAGDFNFDTNRITFDNVGAETGGGHLTLGGAVSYGGAFNYVLNARSEQVRVRYPVGMSWLVGGNLRLAGNAQASTLSGRITVDRLLMAEGFDLASFMTSAQEPSTAPATNSAFLQNLQFDVQADSSPDARMEWAGARLQTEANLRLRGTWGHPILLGHIHLLSGEMNFRGNQYTISRGDINFANPFRMDPVLNVEASTTIRQYEVTLDFSGPASRLTLAYRSDPPLPSSDIIELLALGQTGQESAARTATGQNNIGASALLSEAISSQLGGRIQRLFGVSHFSVGPSIATLSTQQNSIASVTIEQQVTRGLVITYITDLTTTQYQVIQIEYTINRELSLLALRDENGTFGLDIVRRSRFK